MPDWSAPDARGVRTAWLTDPNKASLRGKRQRRADPGAPLDLDAWPGAWRSLLAAWVRRATAETRLRWASLLKAAGEAGANNVQPLLDTLLAAGQLELEEHRDPRLGWQSMWVRFTDPAELRARLGIAEPDADLNRWQVLHGQPFEHPELDAARLALDTLPPTVALRRHQLLAGLAAWRSEGRHRGTATQRDFAWFCRGDTKAISDSEWRWLGEQVDLAQWGISAHAPLLLLAGTLTLAGPGGFVAVDALSGFLGLPPQAIATITTIPRPPRQWLLVENHTAFEQAARALPPGAALVWLPGYPPGWWREAMGRLLDLAPAPARIACDPDPDGIAIALQAGRLWEERGLAWQPWQMEPAQLVALAHRRPVSDRDRDLLGSLLDRALPPALAELARWMVEHGEKGEQEPLFTS